MRSRKEVRKGVLRREGVAIMLASLGRMRPEWEDRDGTSV